MDKKKAEAPTRNFALRERSPSKERKEQIDAVLREVHKQLKEEVAQLKEELLKVYKQT